MRAPKRTLAIREFRGGLSPGGGRPPPPADRRLNEVYTAALNALNHPGPNSAPYNREIPKRLIAAERAWIAFRDAECSYKSTIALGGTGEGYAYVACRYEQTKERVRALIAPDEPHIAR